MINKLIKDFGFKYTIWLALTLTALFFFAVFTYLDMDRKVYVSEAEVTNKNQTIKTQLPIFNDIPADPGHYYISFNLIVPDIKNYPNKFRIIPDDCARKIIINEEVVDLEKRLSGDVCDYINGFTIDLKQYLYRGENKVFIEIENIENPYGIRIFSQSTYEKQILFLKAALFLLFVVVGCHYLRFSTSAIFLISAANCMFLLWFFLTDASLLSMDYSSHHHYIKYMAKHVLPPHPVWGAGWVSYQPPFYYAINGWIKSFVETLSGITTDKIEYLRIVSLIAFNVFLFTATKIISSIKMPRIWFLYAMLLLLFWPAGIMISGRIDSNLFLCAFCSLSFMHLYRWYRQPDYKSFVWCLVFLGLGIATRSNAYVLVPVIACTALYQVMKKRVLISHFYNRNIFDSLFVVLLGVVLNTGRIVYYRIKDNTGQSLIVGNDDSWASWWISNNISTPWHFLSLDYTSYINKPFLDIWASNSTNNFWNILIKSSAFGEFSFRNWEAGSYLSMAVLVFWGFAILPLIFYRRGQFSEVFPFVMLLFWSVAGLVVNRINVPVPPSGDFRYIYFILPALIILNVRHLRWTIEKGYILIGSLGVLACVSIPFLSLWLYISEAWH